MNKATTAEAPSIPTRQELEVLKGLTYGMSLEEIGKSLDKPVEIVSQDVGSLIQKWHRLEDGRRQQVAAQRGC